MEIMERIVAEMLSRGEVAVALSPGAAKHAESKAFETLGRIRSILADDEMDDPDCFQRIEQIVCALEEIGIDCGGRHDFG